MYSPPQKKKKKKNYQIIQKQLTQFKRVQTFIYLFYFFNKREVSLVPSLSSTPTPTKKG